MYIAYMVTEWLMSEFQGFTMQLFCDNNTGVRSLHNWNVQCIKPTLTFMLSLDGFTLRITIAGIYMSNMIKVYIDDNLIDQ